MSLAMLHRIGCVTISARWCHGNLNSDQMVNGQYRLSETLDAYATLSLLSLWRCLDPYPAVSVRCTCPPLPQRQRPHVTRNTFGTREKPCKTISTGSAITGVQSFADVQAPTLARPPDRSHRSPQTGRPGRLHHASPEGLPAPGCGIATCLHGHLTRLDFHQLDGSLVGGSFSHALTLEGLPLLRKSGTMPCILLLLSRCTSR